MTEPQPKKINPSPQQVRNAAALCGFVAFNVGLLGYDWRLAFGVSGLLILTAAVIGTVKTLR